MLNPHGLPGGGVGPLFDVDCAGTLINGGKHIVTAGHCVCLAMAGNPRGFKVNVGSEQRTAIATYTNFCSIPVNDKNDYAIVELDQAVSASAATPYPVYNNSQEVGKRMEFVGWGVTGNGQTILDRKCSDGREDGNFRWAESECNSLGQGDNYVQYTFRGPSTSGVLPNEGVCCSGDSGGPAFIEEGGITYVAGVNSGNDRGCSGKYGTNDRFCRLSSNYAWIQDVIAGNVKPYRSI